MKKKKFIKKKTHKIKNYKTKKKKKKNYDLLNSINSTLLFTL